MANGYTGKTCGVDFRLPTPVRRQAVEYLRSRGFEGVAVEKVQTDAFALCWRDGGSFDLGLLRVRGEFASRTLERAFNKLGVSGLCDFAPKGNSRLCTIRLGLPVVPGYYIEPGARFVEIGEVAAPAGTGGRLRASVTKWKAAGSSPGAGELLIYLAPVSEDGTPYPLRELPAAEVYKHFAKLRQGVPS